MSKIFRKTDFGNGVKYYYLFGWMYAKKVRDCFYLLKRAKGGDEYDQDEWYVGWHSWTFGIYYEECGYETGNAELNISILGWHSTFKLPWKSKRFPDGDCDAPCWGIAIHDNTFWLYKGGDGNWGGGTKWWTWNIPWFTWEHVRHDVQCNIGDFDNPDIRMVSYDSLQWIENKKYIDLKDNDLVYKYHYDYTDSYDGTVVPCTFWVEEREWRRKWFKKINWSKARKVSRYIEIDFDGEVGPGKKDWKGGCVGCSYDLLPGEDPMDCIKRMEKERKF